MADGLVIKPVETPAEREAFLRVPWSIYSDDPAWVPPLLQERRDFLNPAKNPIFKSADVQLWLALRNGRPVGRISAQVNAAHLARHDDASGQFGLLEAEDRAETFQALLTTAETWLRERGMRRVVGPFSLSINQESGLLVDGYDTPPVLMMGHARPYYAERLEAAGYAKAKDLISYLYTEKHSLPAVTTRMIEKVSSLPGFAIRSLNMRRYDEDLKAIVEIFNDAWAENWGFIPLSTEELKALARDLKPIVRPETVAIAEIHGRPVAMIISLPNVNEAIADLDGRLLPFGWAKLLWRLKVRTPRTARIPLMGVRREYQSRLTGAGMTLCLIDQLRRAHLKLGIEQVEISWILEDNLPALRVVTQFDGVPYKTYRVYARDLD